MFKDNLTQIPTQKQFNNINQDFQTSSFYKYNSIVKKRECHAHCNLAWLTKLSRNLRLNQIYTSNWIEKIQKHGG